jgi:hypothetical protein
MGTDTAELNESISLKKSFGFKKKIFEKLFNGLIS